MSLSMRASKYAQSGQPILRQGPVAGTTTYGGSGYERFAGPMAYSRGAMAGDPGLFGFLGKVVKGAAGVVGGLGIPVVSGVARTVAGLIPGQAPVGPGMPGPAPSMASRVFGGGSLPILRQALPGQVPTPGIVGAGQRLIPGGATGYEGCGNGTRPNKSGYWLQSGQYVEPGSVCVRRRRMNPLNPRALSRAMRRIESAKRASSVLGRITIRKKC